MSEGIYSTKMTSRGQNKTKHAYTGPLVIKLGHFKLKLKDQQFYEVDVRNLLATNTSNFFENTKILNFGQNKFREKTS